MKIKEMNKSNIFLSIVVLLFLSYSNKSQGFELKGKLNNANKKKIVLDALSISGVKSIDSTITNESGDFNLKIATIESGFYRLHSDIPKSYLILYLNNQEKINLTGDLNNLQSTSVIKGSPESEKMLAVNMELQKTLLRSDSLNNVFNGYANSPQKDSIIPILQAEYQNLMTSENRYLKKFIQENPTSLTTLTFIDKMDKDQDFKTYKFLDENLIKAYPTNPYVLDFHKRVIDMGKLMEGSPAPDFTLNTPEGNKISLSSFKGKVLLVDFWASWCGPCRQENPNVVRIYNQYHEKGFEILGVSLDKSKEKWVEAIAKDKLTWNHVSDLGQWSSAVVPLYGITGIPLTILVDRNGNIAAKSLRGKELESKVAELLVKQ
jgi:peroxiredoxin